MIETEIADIETEIDEAKSKIALLSAYEAGQPGSRAEGPGARSGCAEYERAGRGTLSHRAVRPPSRLCSKIRSIPASSMRFKLFNVLVNVQLRSAVRPYQGVP